MPSWIAPKTFVAGDYLSFTELNAAFGDNGDLHWLKDALTSIGITADSGQQTVDSALVGARAYGGNQEIPDSQWTEVTWSQQRFGRFDGRDMNYLVSSHPTRLHLTTRTPLSNVGGGHAGLRGYYAVGAHVAFAGNTTGTRGIRIAYYGVGGGTTSAVLAVKTKEATGAGAAMALSLMTFPPERHFTGDGFVCEVYQDSGDNLSLEAITGASPEMWIVKLAGDI